MALQSPEGIKDLLPQAAYAQQTVVRIANETFARYGYSYMEPPTIENAEVFTRGIGEATDVVGKEMYHVYSTKGVQSLLNGQTLQAKKQLALRPEGTAGVARAVVQHNLVPPGAPTWKIWYAGSMFRHERPQQGRFREFHQIGVECLGAAEPTVDAEVILMLMDFYLALGIPRQQMLLKINSMGDENCRPAYRAAVREFILAHDDALCPECQRRANTNPLRAFDCKNVSCQAVLTNAPRITDVLCPECANHYAFVKSLLDASGMAYQEDSRLVRGLDYYTRTVFEVQVEAGLGSQNAIGGGGRYDRLLEEYGAKPTPGLGFAVGLERIVLVLEELSLAPQPKPLAQIFVAAVDEDSRAAAFALAKALRSVGVSVELDHQARSLKSQLKLADKLAVNYVVVVGPDEMASGRYRLRNMIDHGEQDLSHSELLELLALLVSSQENR